MMDDVFLNEEHSHLAFNGHDHWDVDGDQSSFLPVADEGNIKAEQFAIEMDICAPLSLLKSTLEQKLGVDLSHCQLWLQDTVLLAEDSTLSEHCHQREGVVQVNLEFKSAPNQLKINIVDVLPPQEDSTAFLGLDDIDCNDFEAIDAEENIILNENECQIFGKMDQCSNQAESNVNVTAPLPPTPLTPSTSSMFLQPSVTPQSASNENITKWIMDPQFRKEQERLKIPLDPALWTKSHVQHWIKWSINQFNLKNVRPEQWAWVDGPTLCNMTLEDYISQHEPNDLFWTHIELLRQCKFVGVIQKPLIQYVTTPLTLKEGSKTASIRSSKGVVPKTVSNEGSISSGNRSGNNGQTQLWQFLLELLTDINSREAISWMGTDGEFKLNNPEMVAQLWGERKNKPHMNYEKLSRALRYYYDGEMISKVHGKRFVYKFVCDLKQLLGFSAEELSKLVIESEQRLKHNHHVDLP